MSDYPKFTKDIGFGAAYCALSGNEVVATKDLGFGVVVDIDVAGKVVGIEILWDAK